MKEARLVPVLKPFGLTLFGGEKLLRLEKSKLITKFIINYYRNKKAQALDLGF